MKKYVRIISTALILVLMLSTVVNASNFSTDLTPGAADIVNLDSSNGLIKTIIGVIQFVGYAIAVGMLIFIGIKYMMASANEKADLKSSLVKYVIGAVLIAGGTTIASWIFSAVK